jgi:hypothetical protein
MPAITNINTEAGDIYQTVAMIIHSSCAHIISVTMSATAGRQQIYPGTPGKAVAVIIIYLSSAGKIVYMSSSVVRHSAPPFYL